MKRKKSIHLMSLEQDAGLILPISEVRELDIPYRPRDVDARSIADQSRGSAYELALEELASSFKEDLSESGEDDEDEDDYYIHTSTFLFWRSTVFFSPCSSRLYPLVFLCMLL
ncbi:hypothetical protein HAX54_002863 [Datura stramonium]|uniref:Uncharacterized protein n=1 Tax=Datura stramonium TaxID=4076 RepID=A0ABS8T5Q9_DATST|nr:hypothetical protein [Datura stramonium]